MRSPIAPASDAIFNAVIYTNGQLVSSPQTDEQWNRLRAHAESLRTAAEQMTSLAPESNGAVWIRESAALANAATAAGAAADHRSLDGVLDAGGNIYATCTACHAAYMPKD
jgi:hypothetical protein